MTAMFANLDGEKQVSYLKNFKPRIADCVLEVINKTDLKQAAVVGRNSKFKPRINDFLRGDKK